MTWGCQAEFTGRRVSVPESASWESIYILDLNAETARFAGHLLPEIPRQSPCYDRALACVIDADGAEAVFVVSGRHHGHYFIIVNGATQ